jgi:hypothetical protein
VAFIRNRHPTRSRRSADHPCVWITPRAGDTEWGCRIEREPAGEHHVLPGVSTLEDLLARAHAHRAARIVVSERVYAELVEYGVAPEQRPAILAICT